MLSFLYPVHPYAQDYIPMLKYTLQADGGIKFSRKAAYHMSPNSSEVNVK